jgi:flagellar biosynthesis protein FlhA
LVLLPEDAATAANFDVSGENAREPVYGAAARWIDPKHQEDASAAGLPIISPIEVLATHLMETVQNNLDRLFTRRTLRRLLDAYVSPSDPERAKSNQQLLDEFIPDKISLDLLQAVLRLLLAERVPVRNLQLILEAMAEVRGQTAPEQIAEHVRRRIGYILTAPLIDETGSLPLVQLDAAWEELFSKHQLESSDGVTDIALPPGEFNRFAHAVQEKLTGLATKGRYAAVVTLAHRRRFVQQTLAAKGVKHPVLSYEEIGHTVRPALLGAA